MGGVKPEMVLQGSNDLRCSGVRPCLWMASMWTLVP